MCSGGRLPLQDVSPLIAGQRGSDLRCSGVAGVALHPRYTARTGVNDPRYLLPLHAVGGPR